MSGGFGNTSIIEDMDIDINTNAGIVDKLKESSRANGIYIYKRFITENSPRAQQPASIVPQLKPHQLAALRKAIVMEREGYTMFKSPTSDVTKISANVGILGDVVGYGKTLTALGIIAATNMEDMHHETRMVVSRYRSATYLTEETDIQRDIPPTINSTLVVVPHGPVFMQWANALAHQTKLSCLLVDKNTVITSKMPAPDSVNIIGEFNKWDVVLVKATMVRPMFDRYYGSTAVQRWKRIMVDEAHVILNKVPRNLTFNFMWLISATYHEIQSCNSCYINDFVSCYDKILIRGDTEFVKSSFNVPREIEVKHICRMPSMYNNSMYSHVRQFLSKEVLEKINAHDFSGAILAAGGRNETEVDFVKIVTSETERELKNRQKELMHVESLDIPADQKQGRVKTIQTAIDRLTERLNSIRERVSELSDKNCPICYDIYENPSALECTHTFCARCIVDWIKTNHNSCPECRHPINNDKIVTLVPAGGNNGAGPSTAPAEDLPLTKQEALLKIIKDKPNGKFLVFSKYSASFEGITEVLYKNNIHPIEMKGTTAQMMHNLENFKNGSSNVILLNTHFAGSGIDISSATDVIIFHAMGSAKIQAVGRAQRVGRTSTLTVHNLLYSNEVGA
jgi:SNF2 family DNA or RNA helicase